MQKMECGDVRALAESSMGAAADNADLLERIACGDAAAFVELMRRYDALVGATVRNCHLSHADAADAVQNTWMRLLERSSTIREPEKLGGWLATTARRECLVEIRRRRHELQYDPSGMEYPCLDPTPRIWRSARTHGERCGTPQKDWLAGPGSSSMLSTQMRLSNTIPTLPSICRCRSAALAPPEHEHFAASAGSSPNSDTQWQLHKRGTALTHQIVSMWT